jgi:hypothetical protein
MKENRSLLRLMLDPEANTKSPQKIRHQKLEAETF